MNGGESKVELPLVDVGATRRSAACPSSSWVPFLIDRVRARLANDQNGATRLMRDSLGHGSQRFDTVQAATADDEQVGVRGRGDQRCDGLVGQFLPEVADEPIDHALFDLLPTMGPDRDHSVSNRSARSFATA